eukprot:3765650-Lingulodinium_polyedra.AAC.1
MSPSIACVLNRPPFAAASSGRRSVSSSCAACRSRLTASMASWPFFRCWTTSCFAAARSRLAARSSPFAA